MSKEGSSPPPKPMKGENGEALMVRISPLEKIENKEDAYQFFLT